MCAWRRGPIHARLIIQQKAVYILPSDKPAAAAAAARGCTGRGRASHAVPAAVRQVGHMATGRQACCGTRTVIADPPTPTTSVDPSATAPSAQLVSPFPP